MPLDDMEKLKRRLSRFMNVGKRNVGVSDEFGGAVYDPKELIKPLKPTSGTGKQSSAKTKDVMKLSEAEFDKLQAKLGVRTHRS